MENAVAELRENVLRASNVREACSLLLDFVVDHFEVGRAVVFLVHAGRSEIVTHGVPEGVSDGWVRRLQKRYEPEDGGAVGGGTDPTTLQTSDVGELTELADALFVPIPDSRGGAWGGVVVDMDRIHTTTHLVRTVRETAPVLGLLAELEASRERETRLRTRQGWFRLILDTLPDPTLVTDKDHRILYSNRRADHLLTADGDASPGRRHAVERNNLIFSAHRAEVALAKEGPRELIFVDPLDGSDLLFEVETFPVPASVSTEEGCVFLLRDITELKPAAAELRDRVKRTVVAEQAERNRELEAHREELERAFRLKSQFLATMSHELRTPLNAIIGYTDLLREGVLGEVDEKQKDALDRQQRQSEHLLSLINDILDLSKVEAGRIELNVELVQPESIIQEVTESIRPRVEAKEISFHSEVAPDVPAVRSDPQRLHQILLNLLSNAVKFTREGAITVRARPGDDGYAVAFEVVDTGIGIREEDLDAIFSVFRQVDQTVTREHKGTGLGLTISQKLVQLLGGRISVESEPGEGSRFRVDLPAETPSRKDAVPPAPAETASGSTTF